MIALNLYTLDRQINVEVIYHCPHVIPLLTVDFCPSTPPRLEELIQMLSPQPSLKPPSLPYIFSKMCYM